MKLEDVYRKLQPNIYAYFYVKTLHREAAEDLTHEVFYLAFKNFSSFKGKSTIKTWVFSIAKNVLKNYYRSQKYHQRLTEKMEKEKTITETLENEVVKKENNAEVLHLIHSLNYPEKDIVVFRIFGELSFREIGDLLGKSENYARITFHRAKLKLQKELKKDE
ncbi:RNA polymerase sigma factor [Evansella cellulosilytica]|uniref:RNA polymerase, sigma-24 subunit, ECF subfamily n=1 Tax=Evansella cellulosilytica (strain ATCC 21833 / DSM 2522 / FERM P-1141 / JCM 9156 / N-4) TaxID=649639 RepID=E6TQU1_EVAC2|nr:sigma-70 family RNA polymerase sigma factor [Evansella cellulosilytica]ADU31716.1 RNA polymerase, sigma-24 subunit, ECF subfamily [Evansella cellulosilytica DSM 2522]